MIYFQIEEIGFISLLCVTKDKVIKRVFTDVCVNRCL